MNRRDVLTALGGASLLNGAAQAAELPISTRELWGWVRAQQVLDAGLTYLDTAGVGPGLRGPLAVEYRQQEDFHADPEGYLRTRLNGAELRAVLTRLGKWVGADAEQLAITQGATEALAVVAHGLRHQLSAGDEVLVTAQAHNSAVYPWLTLAQDRGVIVKQVSLPSPLEAPEQPLGLIASAITDRTRVLVLSHLQHTDGALLPVADICTFARQRNILTVIDGAQALGSVDVNVDAIGCDFYAASLHKWLNGPYGLGLLYVRRTLLPALLPSNVDSNVGWSTINRYGRAEPDDADRATWPATLAKFGCNVRFALTKLAALQATLEFREQLGSERIAARIRELAIYARLRLQSLPHIELLTPAQPGMWAGIVAFKSARHSSQELTRQLARGNRIIVGAIAMPSAAADPPALAQPAFSAVRVSLNIHNSHDDVERLFRALS